MAASHLALVRLFGEEIPSLWLSEREALKCYLRVSLLESVRRPELH